MKKDDYTKAFGYLLEYTKIYRTTTDKYLREAKILKLQVPNFLVPPTKDQLIVGEIQRKFIGFSPQFGGKYMYCFNIEPAEQYFNEYRPSMTDAQIQEISEIIEYWKKEKTAKKANDRFRELHADTDPYNLILGRLGEQGRVGVAGTPDIRLALTIPDYDKLLQLGTSGLRDEITRNMNPSSTFTQALLLALETIEDAIDYYKYQICIILEKEPDNTNMRNIYSALDTIRYQKPGTFLEALQLYWIYAVIAEVMNHGRMDVYLGDFYAHDISKGLITDEYAIALLTDLWKKFKKIGNIHDTRVIVGGKGRRNPANADNLAMVIMETSRRFKDVLPQLTLRYYHGMNEAVYDKALRVNAEGCSYPIIYSDETNIKAVSKAFGIPESDAACYIPAGCGEYVLEARSVGSPNSAVNLAKAVELALHRGKDMYYLQQAGPDTGDPASFETFEDLWTAFTAQIDAALPMVAWAEKECYNIIAENCGCLHLSLLMKDCIERQKPLLEGGVRYFTGMTEVNGMITAADSLVALKKLVYEEKRFTLPQVVAMLDADYEGYETERKLFQNAPKYGNDNDEADAMAQKVYEYIARQSLAYTGILELDRYMMVSVNNSDSATWGEITMATPCGRKNGEALSNANSASIGADTNGVTSLLNSMSKFDHSLHAGVINNVRFTKELFNESFGKMKTLLTTFFENNGTQMNLMIVGKDDLMNARKEPDKYKNLIVRIGGFSARFVELDPVVQEEIIRRTTYETS